MEDKINQFLLEINELDNESSGRIELAQDAREVFKSDPLYKPILKQLETEMKNINNNQNDNIVHFYEVSQLLKENKLGKIVAINRRFSCTSSSSSSTTVTIVCNGGLRWIKVKVGRIRSLLFDKDSENRLLREVKTMYDVAQQCTVVNKAPRVEYYFKDSENLGKEFIQSFLNTGVHLYSPVLESSEVKENEKVLINLDITALIALVSDEAYHDALNTTSESKELKKFVQEIFNNVDFQVVSKPKVSRHATNSVNLSIFEILYDYWKRKHGKISLITTRFAYDIFEEILKSSGNEMEHKRAAFLFQSKNLLDIQVVPNQVSQRVLVLNEKSTTVQHVNIFGTGDQLLAYTLTANVRAIRKFNALGIQLLTLIHKPASLNKI